MRAASAFALAILLASARPAGAVWADAIGMPAQQCKDWIASADDKLMHAGMLLWVTGYIAGAAVVAHVDQLPGIDPSDVDAMLTRRCATHPDEPIYAAARALLPELMPTTATIVQRRR